MSLSLSKRKNFPSLMPDWLRPVSSLWDRDLFDLDMDFMPKQVGVNIPSVNISETPNSFMLELAAPGLQQKDFKIEVENNTLRVSSEKQEEKEQKENGYSRKEFSYNAFSRSFALPDNVNEDDISANYKDGILKVTIPKVKGTPAKPVHQIPVS